MASVYKRKLTRREIELEEAAKTRIAIWCCFMGAIMFLMVIGQSLKADEMVHKFKSPSFSGVGT